MLHSHCNSISTASSFLYQINSVLGFDLNSTAKKWQVMKRA